MLESVQRHWTKQVFGMHTMGYEERLRALDQYSIQGRLLRADLIYYWKVFHGKCAVVPTDLFTLSEHCVTRGHRFKVELPRTQTDFRKRSLSVRCIMAWNRLPEEVVSTSDLSVFKSRLADCLGDALYRYHH